MPGAGAGGERELGTASLSARLRGGLPPPVPAHPHPHPHPVRCPPHRGAEPMLQQQVEAAQVAAAELGSLAGAGLSVRDGSHRVDDIYGRRRGQTGRGLPGVRGCLPLPASALEGTRNRPSPQVLRVSGEDPTHVGAQVCPQAQRCVSIETGRSALVPTSVGTRLRRGVEWVSEGTAPSAPPLPGSTHSPPATRFPVRARRGRH